MPSYNVFRLNNNNDNNKQFTNENTAVQAVTRSTYTLMTNFRLKKQKNINNFCLPLLYKYSE